MSTHSKSTLYKSYLIGLSFFLFSLFIIIQLIKIQNSPNKKKYEQFAKGATLRSNIITAKRGNLYDVNESLLATTVSRYDIYVDLKCISSKLFKENISALCLALSSLFEKPETYFFTKLNLEKQKGNQYFLLAKNLSYSQYKQIKEFPILKKGRIKGGLIVKNKMLRIYPLEKLAKRTIGYDDHRGKAGLEGAFSEFLRGKDGSSFEQLIGPNLWKPISKNLNYVEPSEGMDVYTTIDMNIQELAYSALLKGLINAEAKHGCVIVMDVKTSEIHALVNLEKTNHDTYEDVRNFALWEASEPGSTFKTIALLAALKDKKITPDTLVDTGKGTYFFKGKTIKDSKLGGYGLIKAKEVLAFSSNIGMVKLIYEAYKENPKAFLNHLKKWQLDKKIGIDIPGEGIPFVPKLGGKHWSGLTLAWLSFGYNLKLTPLQIISFYNAIANDGKLLKPIFIKKVSTLEGDLKIFESQKSKKSLASAEIIKQIQEMLEGSTKNGTAKKYYNKDYPYAGKTGTTQLEYWKKKEQKDYKSSFVGYFPADAPKYSVIVVVSKPKKRYYGGEVALPIFDEIAKSLYLKIARKKYIPDDNCFINHKIESYPKIELKKKIMPNLIGYPGKEVLPILEKSEIKVIYKGVGKVLKQSILPGTILKENQILELILQ